MEMSLIELRVLELELVAEDLTNPRIEVPEESQDQYKLAYELAFPEEDRRSFAVIFNCAVKVAKLKHIRVVYLARFGTNEEIDEEFKSSHWTGMNAPAISYPYLRAYVGQMLLISGYKPVTLPTMNFQAIYHQKKQKLEEESQPQLAQKAG